MLNKKAEKKHMAKTTKKTSASKKSANKKFDVKKNWKKLAYFGVIALLVISVLSYVMVNKIENNRSAKAYAYIGSIYNVNFGVCKFIDQFGQIAARVRYYNTQSSTANVSRLNYAGGIISTRTLYAYGTAAEHALSQGGISANSTYKLSLGFRVERNNTNIRNTLYFSWSQATWCNSYS